MDIVSRRVAGDAMRQFSMWLTDVNALLAPVEHGLFGKANMCCQYDAARNQTQFIVDCRVVVLQTPQDGSPQNRVWRESLVEDIRWETRCYGMAAVHAPRYSWAVWVDESAPPPVRADIVAKGAIAAFDHYFTAILEPHLKRWSEIRDNRHP